MNKLEDSVKKLRRAYNILNRARILCERDPSREHKEKLEQRQTEYEVAYENVIDVLVDLKRP